jgi:hypothetical protein
MTAMLLASANHNDSATLSDRIHDTPIATASLLREIVDTCRNTSPGQSARAARIARLLSAGAFAEVALALIDLELPQWHLRRIVYDGGEWHCALSRAPELPDWLDQSIEARHHDLALAILAAFVEAQLASTPTSRPSVPTVRHAANVLYAQMCDNFA